MSTQRRNDLIRSPIIYIRNKLSGATARLDTVHPKKLTSSIVSGIRRRQEPLSDTNWYARSAEACEATCDALLGTESGYSHRIAKTLAGKLGFAGTGAGIFSLASLLGTAGTGTAIGSLSGAAFTNAALAWVGGSMVVGTAAVGAASVAGGIGAIFGIGWIKKKYISGKARRKNELNPQEKNVLEVCLSLAIAFREQEKVARILDPISANSIYNDALKPLIEELTECKYSTNSWPIMARRRLKSATTMLQNVAGYLYRWKHKNPNAVAGIVSIVILQLLAKGTPIFNEREQFVLEALRRSNNNLTNASDEELAIYIQGMEPNQLSGLINNIKGIYHELAFQNKENNDSDQFIVEIFDATNHQGSDVRIIDTLTNEVTEVQLKATNYISYIREHNSKYENIEVFATEEVANLDDEITSSGFSNSDLNEDVTVVFDELSKSNDPSIMDSVSIAAMVTLARNSRMLLKGESISIQEKKSNVEMG